MDQDHSRPNKIYPDGLVGAFKELTTAILLGIARGNDVAGGRVFLALNDCHRYLKESEVPAATAIDLALQQMNEQVIYDPTIPQDLRIHSDLSRSILRLVAYLSQATPRYHHLAREERGKIKDAVHQISHDLSERQKRLGTGQVDHTKG